MVSREILLVSVLKMPVCTQSRTSAAAFGSPLASQVWASPVRRT